MVPKQITKSEKLVWYGFHCKDEKSIQILTEPAIRRYLYIHLGLDQRWIIAWVISNYSASESDQNIEIRGWTKLIIRIDSSSRNRYNISIWINSSEFSTSSKYFSILSMGDRPRQKILKSLFTSKSLANPVILGAHAYFLIWSCESYSYWIAQILVQIVWLLHKKWHFGVSIILANEMVGPMCLGFFNENSETKIQRIDVNN